MDIYKYPIEGKMDYWHTAPLHLRLLDSYIRTAELGLTFESSQIESFFFFKIFIVDKIDQFIFFWILDHYLSTLEAFFFFTPKI